MATEAEVEQLFESMRARGAEIATRDAPQRTGGNLGCLMMLAALGGGVGLVVALGEANLGAHLWGWPTLVVVAVLLGSFVVGWKIGAPWFTANSDQRGEADRVLLRPLAALLLPGATFTRAQVTWSRVNPSLLLPEPRGVAVRNVGRIEGRLFGHALTIDETRSDFDDHLPRCWIVRLELPFVLAAHLRVHRRTWADAGRFWEQGFEKLDEDGARLGPGYKVEVAPLGIGTDEGVAATPPGAVPPGVLLTDELFGVLRARPHVSLAVAGRTLWMIVEDVALAFDSQVPAPDDLKKWKHAAVSMQDVEAVTRAVLAAASVRA